MKPLCFVLMPFASKPDPTGGKDIDFDRIYESAIRPAIDDAEMEAIRADQEKTGGIIHKTMFERLLLCDFAVADLTTANANVFYELGVRHTARPSTTVTIFAEHQPIPFDVNYLRSLPYQLGDDNRFDDEIAGKLRSTLSRRLVELRELSAKNDVVDSPLFLLLGNWKVGDIARIKTDVFRDQVNYNEALKSRLADIRSLAGQKENRDEARQQLLDLRQEIGKLDSVDGGTAIDLMLTYRALGDWVGMIEVQRVMPRVLKDQVLVQEQLAFALNRQATSAGDARLRRQALETLEKIEQRQGASSETCGLIGRIYKDYWQESIEAGNAIEAIGHLAKAIDAYTRGFMADQRDAYPGINAVTLLDIKGDSDSLALRSKLVPVVLFAVERRLDLATADYWDHATILELAVLDNDPAGAATHLGNALASVRESWEPQTTENNLQLIEQARNHRNEDTSWLKEIIAALRKKRESMT